MGRTSRTLLLAVIVAGSLGLSACQSGQSTPQGSVPATPAASASGAPANSARPQGTRGAGMPTMGTVQHVAGPQLTVQTQNGTTNVTLTDSTTISRQETGTLADVTVGATVTVSGQNQGKALVADTVQIGSETAFTFGPGGAGGQQGGPQGGQARVPQANSGATEQQGGQQNSQPPAPRGNGDAAGPQGGGGQANPANRGRLTGSVASVAADGFTVTTSTGQTKVTLESGASVQKIASATAVDVKEGVGVLVVGDPGADGVVVAGSVLITPAGLGR
jgi:hypothetical protein